MTTMKNALIAAGVVTDHAARLKACATEAIKTSNNNWDSAKSNFYRAIRDDAPLLWTLFDACRQEVVQRYLTGVVTEMRDAQPLRRPSGQQRAAAPSGSGQIVTEIHGKGARSAPPPREKPVRDPRAGMDVRIEVVRRSMLDTFIINGQPIGDLTANEAIKWAGSRERDARFVRMLTANMPGYMPIRLFSTPDIADDLWARAQEMENAE